MVLAEVAHRVVKECTSKARQLEVAAAKAVDFREAEPARSAGAVAEAAGEDKAVLGKAPREALTVLLAEEMRRG